MGAADLRAAAKEGRGEGRVIRAKRTRERPFYFGRPLEASAIEQADIHCKPDHELESGMPLYELGMQSFEAVPTTTFADEGVLERKHLQRLLCNDITPIGSDLMVLAEEFGEWEDCKRRIDLLCIDKKGALVVVEIKRTEDGGHMELQAVRYAAMVSGMTVEQAVHAHAKMIGGVNAEEMARKNIVEFLAADAIEEVDFDSNVRIILVAADFSQEITTSVLWLNKYDINITCIRLKPYKINNRVFVDLTQVIPLPEAEDYEVKLRAQAQEARKAQSLREETLRRFWTQLIQRSHERTGLFAKKSPTSDSWISVGIGRGGFSLYVSQSKGQTRIECYITFGQYEEKTVAAFNALRERRQKIETTFGEQLDWQELPGRLGSRICTYMPGSWMSPEAEWPALQDEMIAILLRLEKSLRPEIQMLQF